MFQMNVESHRNRPVVKYNDDDEDGPLSDGELDSSLSDTNDESEMTPSKPVVQQTSQSWTTMLTEQNLSSIMSNALADNSQIIHIDDPIAQQSANPLTYVFPPGTNVDEYFERKQKQNRVPAKRPATRRELKNLAHLLHREKNEDLLRVIVETIGSRRAFQYAHQAAKLYKGEDASVKQRENGQKRSLGGVYFKMLINDDKNDLIAENEREQIKRRNQEIQKGKQKKQKKQKESKSSGQAATEEN